MSESINFITKRVKSDEKYIFKVYKGYWRYKKYKEFV